MIGYQIKVGKPPNFLKIVTAFPKAQSASTIFAYGDTIYVSHPEIVLSRALVEHERVHLYRQAEMGVEAWWDRYISDSEFRYKEELLAHRAEYLELTSREPDKRTRISRLNKVAKRLTLPLYKFGVSLEKAKEDILNTRNL